MTPLPLPFLPFPPKAARASTVPALDGVWSSLTGAPPDLYFPAEAFEGEFDAVSELVSAEAPLGEGVLSRESLAGLRRAREEDLGRPLRYRIRFMRPPPGNPATPPGAVVFDRAFNLLSLLAATSPAAVRGAFVEWDASDPNLLTLKFRGTGGGAGGEGGTGEREGETRGRTRGSVRLKVTKRSEEAVSRDRIDTSEFVQTVFLNDNGESNGVPRTKATQVFSKWRWRRDDNEGGGGNGDAATSSSLAAAAAAKENRKPTVIATQVVSEFLGEPEPGNERSFISVSGRPVAVFTYRLALTRVPV